MEHILRHIREDCRILKQLKVSQNTSFARSLVPNGRPVSVKGPLQLSTILFSGPSDHEMSKTIGWNLCVQPAFSKA